MLHDLHGSVNYLICNQQVRTNICCSLQARWTSEATVRSIFPNWPNRTGAPSCARPTTTSATPSRRRFKSESTVRIHQLELDSAWLFATISTRFVDYQINMSKLLDTWTWYRQMIRILRFTAVWSGSWFYWKHSSFLEFHIFHKNISCEYISNFLAFLWSLKSHISYRRYRLKLFTLTDLNWKLIQPRPKCGSWPTSRRYPLARRRIYAVKLPATDRWRCTGRRPTASLKATRGLKWRRRGRRRRRATRSDICWVWISVAWRPKMAAGIPAKPPTLSEATLLNFNSSYKVAISWPIYAFFFLRNPSASLRILWNPLESSLPYNISPEIRRDRWDRWARIVENVGKSREIFKCRKMIFGFEEQNEFRIFPKNLKESLIQWNTFLWQFPTLSFVSFAIILI